MFSPDIKILICDDMMTMRKIVKSSLEKLGYKNIVVAKDGAEAWKELESYHPDLIISDWNMPNLTGIELLEKVRGHQSLKDVPFVLLTAEAEAGQIQQALKLGVDNYILKPFAVDTLSEKLGQVYNKRKKAA